MSYGQKALSEGRKKRHNDIKEYKKEYLTRNGNYDHMLDSHRKRYKTKTDRALENIQKTIDDPESLFN